MRVPLRWLSDYVKVELSPEELAHRLAMAGLEVESVEKVGEFWEGIRIGRVVRLERHPNADRLWLATVDLGDYQETVVTGAPNLREGVKVPFAPVGSRLIDPQQGKLVELKAARIRGIESRGMVCSEAELGLSDDHSGIMLLPDDAPVGAPLRDYLGDAILETKPSPNRPDWFSLLGVAREVGALTGQAVTEPPAEYSEAGPPIDQVIRVEIADPDLCLRYCATVITGLKVGPSPEWLQRRLRAAGMRPINNVVDVTNYVMLEWGQPLHAFDLAQVRDHRIIVRRARPGERLVTLDGQERTLPPDALVIADAERAIGLAGIMGGANSEVSEMTTAIVLESANFHPTNIRRTAQALGLRTEASIRFERAIRPELTVPAVRRATALILELAGGQAARGLVDLYPGRKAAAEITVTAAQIRRLLGTEVPGPEVHRVLGLLGCRVEEPESGVYRVTPPFWRSDLNIREDIIEELARIIGYDSIPTVMPAGPLPEPIFDPRPELEEAVRDILVGCGLQEVLTYSLVSRALLDRFDRNGAPEPLRLVNPMSAEQEYLRTSLRPSLVNTLAANRRRGETGPVKIFEVGRVYWARPDDLPLELKRVVGLLSGPAGPRVWNQPERELDFYDAKGVVETLLWRLGFEPRFEPGTDPDLHPGKTALCLVGTERVGVVGELHPRLVEAFELRERPQLFELDLERLG
ncbi:MAG: phenylalanine--tRNA ligase subunit beta, partial [Chloroflexota bacterium]